MEDADVAGVPGGPHQRGLAPVLDEDVGSPDEAGEVVLAVDNLHAGQVREAESLILTYVRYSEKNRGIYVNPNMLNA